MRQAAPRPKEEPSGPFSRPPVDDAAQIGDSFAADPRRRIGIVGARIQGRTATGLPTNAEDVS